MKKLNLLSVVFACIATLNLSPANASLVINVFEVGGDVMATYSGFLDTSATLGYGGEHTNPNEFYVPQDGFIFFTSDLGDYYHVDADWTAFGSGDIGSWDVSSGDSMKLFTDKNIGVPLGYVSGTKISGSATKYNTSIIALGFASGSFVTTLTNGLNTDTVMVNIGAASVVPVPAAVWLFGSGLIGLIGLARRKASI